MLSLQTYLGRLDTSPEDHASLLRTMRAMNAASNDALTVAKRLKTHNKFKVQREAYVDLRARHALSAQMAVRSIAKACESYKANGAAKFEPLGAVQYDQRMLSFKGIDRVSILTLEGRLKLAVRWGDYAEARLGRRRGQADLIFRDDMFYIAVVADVPDETPYEPKGTLGVDLGRKNIATDSDGVIHSSKRVNAVRERTHKLRAILQSVGTKSAKRHLKKLAGREARFALDTNHVISKTLVQKAKGTVRMIALEDLTGIRERITARGPDERRRSASWSFFQLRSFIEYKARAAGVLVVGVDPSYTSQTCFECKHVERANRDREAFLCRACGHEAHADVNAAQNIAHRADVNRPIVTRLFIRHLSDLSCKSSTLVGVS